MYGNLYLEDKKYSYQGNEFLFVCSFDRSDENALLLSIN